MKHVESKYVTGDIYICVNHVFTVNQRESVSDEDDEVVGTRETSLLNHEGRLI